MWLFDSTNVPLRSLNVSPVVVISDVMHCRRFVLSYGFSALLSLVLTGNTGGERRPVALKKRAKY